MRNRLDQMRAEAKLFFQGEKPRYFSTKASVQAKICPLLDFLRLFLN